MVASCDHFLLETDRLKLEVSPEPAENAIPEVDETVPDPPDRLRGFAPDGPARETTTHDETLRDAAAGASLLVRS